MSDLIVTPQDAAVEPKVTPSTLPVISTSASSSGDAQIVISTGTATQAVAESKPKIIFKPGFEHGEDDDAAMFETVVSAIGHFQYASFKDDQVGKIDYLDVGKERWMPPYNLKPFWSLKALNFPSAVAPIVPTADLLGEIQTFLNRYAFMPPEWLEPIAIYVLMTWVYDRFTALPYLRFLGEFGTGKTRMLQTALSLCYRSLLVGGNISGAGLFRTIDLVRGTLGVDEADFKDSQAWSDVIKVFNLGYKVGLPTIRCKSGHKDFEPECFQNFGPKIISTRERFEDPATESRCITFETREVSVPASICFQLPLSFYSESVPIRNKLLHWRFSNFHQIEAREDQVRAISPRLGEVGASLCAVAPAGEIRDRLVKFLGSYDTASKQDGDKALITQAIEELTTDLNGGVHTTVGRIASVATRMAQDLGKPALSPKRVGGILRSSLGIEPRKTRNGYVVDLPIHSTPQPDGTVPPEPQQPGGVSPSTSPEGVPL